VDSYRGLATAVCLLLKKGWVGAGAPAFEWILSSCAINFFVHEDGLCSCTCSIVMEEIDLVPYFCAYGYCMSTVTGVVLCWDKALPYQG
jgi:hypothetical protein